MGEVESGWIQQYDLHNNTLIPGASSGIDMLNAFDVRECTYLVETGCMTILHKECTCTSGNCTTSAELGLLELEAALGG
jgi:hypothetical protein